jgi:hypothetical protein
MKIHDFDPAPFYPNRCDLLTDEDGRRRRCCEPPDAAVHIPEHCSIVPDGHGVQADLFGKLMIVRPAWARAIGAALIRAANAVDPRTP